MIALSALLVIGCPGKPEVREPPPKSTTEGGEATTTAAVASTRPASPCSDVETEAGEATLRSCLRPPDATPACPTADRIAIVVDADKVTEGSRTLNWRALTDTPIGFDSTTCEVDDPLEKHSPGFCETIQHVGQVGKLDNTCSGARPIDRLAKSVGGGTPAAAALSVLVRELGVGALDVAMMAFDGLADECGDGTGTGRFQEQIAAAITAGIGVRVVARPREYRYAYVFSSTRYHAYADELATHLKGRLTAGPSSAWTGVIDLTPHRLQPGASSRGALAQATGGFLRLEGSAVRFPDPRRLTPLCAAGETAGRDGACVVDRLDVTKWLGTPTNERAALELSWAADPSRWDAAAPAGTRLAPPEVRINQPVATADTGAFVTTAGAARPLDQCPAPLQAARTANTRDPDCAAKNAELYQAVTLSSTGARSSARIDLIRQKTGFDWLESDSVLAPRIGNLRSTSGGPLTTIVVVSPALTEDVCAAALNRAFLQVHTWEPSGGAADTRQRMDAAAADLKACDASPLRALRDEFYATEPARFGVACAGSRVAPDLRAGMATLASAIRGASELLVATSGPPEAWREPAAACAVEGVRVVYTCSGDAL